MNYQDKIKKLLALGESSNPHEAQAALLKARKLMYEHKISETDLGTKKSNVIDKETRWTWTTRTNNWMCNLAAFIAQKHCCKSFSQVKPRGKTRHVSIMGFEEDVKTCEIAMDYAFQTVLSGCEEIKKTHKGCTSTELTKLYNGYGWGFWAGLKDAYSQQDIKSNGKYELVLSLPAEVGDYASKKLSKSKKVNIKNVSAGLYNRGFQDGQKFGNIRKLQNALPV